MEKQQNLLKQELVRLVKKGITVLEELQELLVEQENIMIKKGNLLQQHVRI